MLGRSGCGERKWWDDREGWSLVWRNNVGRRVREGEVGMEREWWWEGRGGRCGERRWWEGRGRRGGCVERRWKIIN